MIRKAIGVAVSALMPGAIHQAVIGHGRGVPSRLTVYSARDDNNDGNCLGLAINPIVALRVE